MQLYVLLALCGVVLAKETFIVGGRNVTEPGKWPWMGLIRFLDHNQCGISLISNAWGLTAADCVNHPVEYLTVMFGSNNPSDDTVVVKPKRIIIHEGYPNDLYFNDIALVEFSEEVKGKNIAPLPLAPEGSNHTGNNNCWITGFGPTDTGEMAKLLQEAQTTITTNEACKQHWPDIIIYDGAVCIGDPINVTAPCMHDHGGPLVCEVDGRYELVGVASYLGSVYCDRMPLSFYTRVSYFREWIKTNSGI